MMISNMSCSGNQKTDKENSEVNSQNILYEKEYITAYINKNFDGKTERNPKIYYSISMHTDSMITIYFNPPSTKRSPSYTYDGDLYLEGLQSVLDTILSTIESADSNYINFSHGSLTSLRIKTGSYQVFEKLCKLKEVHALEVSSGQFIMDIYMNEEMNKPPLRNEAQ